MAVIGSIIKTIIHVSDTLLSEKDAVALQEDELRKMLHTAHNTAFGKEYAFDEILEADDIRAEFARRVPYFNYEQMKKAWWYRTIAGELHVTWPGATTYFALSSGTTGNQAKRIPVTDDMLEAIKKTSIHQIQCLSNFDLPSEFFEKDILMLGSSTDLKDSAHRKEGEISGISASNIPFWFKGYYKPGEEIASISNWDDRVKKIVEQAPEWDVGAMSGIPSWIELMLKAIIEHYQLDHIHELWPNLQVYTSGGVAFEPYQKSFDKLLGKPIHVIDTYLASEGFLAYQSRPDTDSMTLSLESGIYFEFVPFKPEYIDDDGRVVENAPYLKLEEVEEGEEYVLIISTVSGAWRYEIGDTIKFTDKEKCEIRITGRTKHFLNVVGSQLSVAKMNDAMRYLEQELGMVIPEFTVAAITNNEAYVHRWYLGIDGTVNASRETLTKKLDRFLASVNKNYKIARSKALKGVEVIPIPVSKFYNYTAELKKKGGQVKIKRVMSEEELQTFESFLNT